MSDKAKRGLFFSAPDVESIMESKSSFAMLGSAPISIALSRICAPAWGPPILKASAICFAMPSAVGIKLV